MTAASLEMSDEPLYILYNSSIFCYQPFLMVDKSLKRLTILAISAHVLNTNNSELYEYDFIRIIPLSSKLVTNTLLHCEFLLGNV